MMLVRKGIALKKKLRCLDKDLARVILVVVTFRLEYCNSLYLKLNVKTQVVQNAAVCLVHGLGLFRLILKSHHWLPVIF